MRLFLALSILMMASQGWSQWGHPGFTKPGSGKKKKPSIPDSMIAELLLNAGESTDPAPQSDENIGSFLKGKGGKAKNPHSVFVKNLKLRRPNVGGNGCAEGTVGISLSEDQRTMSLLFDNYVVQAGNSFGSRRDVKNCTVSVPLDVPAGYQFAVVKIDYRGFNSIPQKGRTRYLTIYSMTDAQSGKQVGRRIRRVYDFRGPLDEEYVISSDVSTAPVWSACGRSMNFRIDTRAVAVSNSRGEDVMATIDSIDASVGDSRVEYHLLWQACN